MKTLQEIKEEVAKEAHFEQWSHLTWDYNTNGKAIEVFMDKVAKRYAEQAIDKCVEVAGKNFQVDNGDNWLDRESILSIKEHLK